MNMYLMRKGLLLGPVLLVMVLCSACSNIPVTVYELAVDRSCQLPDAESLSSIVRVATGDGNSASGVVINNGRVLTVAHALQDNTATFIEVNGVLKQAWPLAINQELDLALLEVDTENLPIMNIAVTDLESNEHVWAVGFPLAQAKRTSLGVFYQSKGRNLLTSAHINSGTSGGGLLRCNDMKYELAGIMRAYVAYEIAGDRINSGDSLAVPAHLLKDFVERSILAMNASLKL